MFEIKNAIISCTDKKIHLFHNDNCTWSCSGSLITKTISVAYTFGGRTSCITIDIVHIPLTKKWVCRQVMVINTITKYTAVVMKPEVQLCTLDDIESWIKSVPN